MSKKLLIVFFFVIISACKQQVKNEIIVYTNDFESNNLTGITNGIITQFNNNSVLGQYNTGNFTLSVNNLPNHHLVTISFDLYIHDSWDGNKQSPLGPDIWQMLVDGDTYINTTFSNESCPPNWFCPPQSYPYNYPNNYNNPKKAAYRTDLPGACSLLNNPNATSLYRIEKTFSHSDSKLLLKCLDKLIQTDSADPKCDESWSVDNIRVKVITL
jgi:hypothetical protein